MCTICAKLVCSFGYNLELYAGSANQSWRLGYNPQYYHTKLAGYAQQQKLFLPLLQPLVIHAFHSAYYYYYFFL